LYWNLAAMNLAEANRILRLSDSQLAIVRQAAVPLSPSEGRREAANVRACSSSSRTLNALGRR
jgi:hypothetical protein